MSNQNNDGGLSADDRPFFRGGPDEPPKLSIDTVFSLLADPTRRAILQHLLQLEDAVIDRDALVDHLAATNAMTDTRDEDRRTQYQVALHHTHLPKLDAAGVIVYQPLVGLVVYHGDPLLERWLERAKDEEQRPDNSH